MSHPVALWTGVDGGISLTQARPALTRKRKSSGRAGTDKNLSRLRFCASPQPRLRGNPLTACLWFDTVFGWLPRICDLWPPVEPGSGFQGWPIFGEDHTAAADDVVEGFESGGMFVDDGLIDEFPERLGRLKFRRVGRQVDEADAVGNIEVCRSTPAGVVDQQDDDCGFRRSRPSISI